MSIAGSKTNLNFDKKANLFDIAINADQDLAK